MKEDKSNWCMYFHPACPASCDKVYCRSKFPEKQLIIMESQKPICKSLEHKECLEFIAGNEYREQRELSRRGCPFLGDHYCGRPKLRYCKGSVPPFEITDNPNLASCYGNDFAECPQYKIGIAFQEESRQVIERGILKGKKDG